MSEKEARRVLRDKDYKAAMTVISSALIDAFGTGAPAPGAEIPKAMIMTVKDAGMCALVWEIYMGEKLSGTDLLERLSTTGLVAAVGGTFFYVGAQGGTALLKELANWLGPLGWIAVGALSASTTALIGAAFAAWCRNEYQTTGPVPTPATA